MPTLLAAAAEEPVSLADAKAWLRLDAGAEDALVASLVAAARAHVEGATRRLLVTQTWRVRCDAAPRDDALHLPFAPLRAVVAVRVVDEFDSPHELAPSQWRVTGAADDPRIRIASSLAGPIEIDAEFGYGAASETPEPLRRAILMLVAGWFEHRGDTQAPASAAAALIAPFARVRLS